MTARATTHATFSLQRVFDATPARAFKAFADPAAKAKWFSAPPEQPELLREMDFRVGGTERLTTKRTEGLIVHFVSHYWDIVPNERIVYAYEMHLNESKISVSLATVEFKSEGKGTRLILTEQGAFLDGLDDPASRESGTVWLLDKLAASLK